MRELLSNPPELLLKDPSTVLNALRITIRSLFTGDFPQNAALLTIAEEIDALDLGDKKITEKLEMLILRIASFMDVYVIESMRKTKQKIWLDQSYPRDTLTIASDAQNGTPEIIRRLYNEGFHINFVTNDEYKSALQLIQQQRGERDQLYTVQETDTAEMVKSAIERSPSLCVVIFKPAKTEAELREQINLIDLIGNFPDLSVEYHLSLTDGLRTLACYMWKGEVPKKTADGILIVSARPANTFDGPKGGLPAFEKCVLLLNAGIPLLELLEERPESEVLTSQISDASAPQGTEVIRRKLHAFFKGNTGESTLRNEYIASHYAQFAKDVEKVAPDLTLPARSGVSALRLALLIASNITGDEAKKNLSVHFCPGYYYEGSQLAGMPQKYDIVEDISMANILCVNHQPSDPKQDELDYTQLAEDKIRSFINLATEQPKSTFFLVYDATLDPSYSIHDFIHSIPPNLVLIKAASLTKHQLGQSSTTSGIVWVWGHDHDLSTALTQTLVESQATLLPYNSITFPLVTPAQIKRRIEFMSHTIESISLEFDQLQSNIPAEYRWKLLKTNMYFFLIPPMRTLLHKLSDALGIPAEEMTDWKNYFQLVSVGKQIKDLLEPHQDIEALIASGAAVDADSFGMLETRVSIFRRSGLFHNSIYRIAPSIRFDSQQHHRLMTMLNNIITKQMHEIQAFEAKLQQGFYKFE